MGNQFYQTTKNVEKNDSSSSARSSLTKKAKKFGSGGQSKSELLSVKSSENNSMTDKIVTRNEFKNLNELRILENSANCVSGETSINSAAYLNDFNNKSQPGAYSFTNTRKFLNDLKEDLNKLRNKSIDSKNQILLKQQNTNYMKMNMKANSPRTKNSMKQSASSANMTSANMKSANMSSANMSGMSATATMTRPSSKTSCCSAAKTMSCMSNANKSVMSSANTSKSASSKTTASARRSSSSAKTSSAKAMTTVSAKADIGWGNMLFIRGEGAGLSWDKGMPMTNTSEDQWTWTTKSTDSVITFKLLLNDSLWATGENMTAKAGSKMMATPVFEYNN